MFPFGYLISLQHREEYVIRLRMLKDWYFTSIETYDPRPVIWTPRIAKAKFFRSDEEVEEFKFNFLHDRSCDIIRIK